MINKIFVHAYKHAWADNIQILVSKHEDNKVYVVKELNFEEANPAELYDPTLYLHYENAQELMDELWSCGMRPTEGTGSAGALAATQKHLEDMRKLVFDFLKPKNGL